MLNVITMIIKYVVSSEKRYMVRALRTSKHVVAHLTLDTLRQSIEMHLARKRRWLWQRQLEMGT